MRPYSYILFCLIIIFIATSNCEDDDDDDDEDEVPDLTMLQFCTGAIWRSTFGNLKKKNETRKLCQELSKALALFPGDHCDFVEEDKLRKNLIKAYDEGFTSKLYNDTMDLIYSDVYCNNKAEPYLFCTNEDVCACYPPYPKYACGYMIDTFDRIHYHQGLFT